MKPIADSHHRTGPVLHIGAPNLGDRQRFDQLVDQMFQRRWFSNHGVLVRELEQQLCQQLGTRHCVTVCNATSGLQLAFQALGLTGEVILPAFTFVATAHAIAWQNLTPVFADIDPTTHQICPDSVASLITASTSAIVPVHLWGDVCDVSALQRIARRHQLKLVYDAAHAFYCRRQGTMVGNFGNCEVFSFHATKFFHTFEGGAIATNDDQLADTLRRTRNFGFAGQDQVDEVGINAKLPEVSAAMGLSMLGQLDDLADHNHANFLCYANRLASVPGIALRQHSKHVRSNWQYVVALIDQTSFGCSRDQLLEHLEHEAILAKRYFYPGCHRLGAYQTLHRQTGRELPQTDAVAQQVLCLPTGTAIGEAEIFEVCELIDRIGASYRNDGGSRYRLTKSA